ncbi:hypothetical protein PQX77_020578 [Marasmius sp. AFHP31]|nr:hypothetical protein PQX77_020578 [Marasmius sp. AFHP31]
MYYSNSASSSSSGYSRIRIDENRNEYYDPSPRSSPYSSPESSSSASLPRVSPYAIHPMLQYKSPNCTSLSYWSTDRDLLKISPQYLNQPAIDPRARVVKIKSRDFPWTITVYARKDVGYVTIYDVLKEVLQFSQKPVTQSELSRERPEKLHSLGQVAGARQRTMRGGCPGIARGDFLGLWSFAGMSVYGVGQDGVPELLLLSRPWQS